MWGVGRFKVLEEGVMWWDIRGVWGIPMKIFLSNSRVFSDLSGAQLGSDLQYSEEEKFPLF